MTSAGPSGAKRVAGFPDEVLAALALEIPGGDVVGDRVAGHAGERVLRGDAARGRADHDRELALPVDARGRRREQDLVVGPDHRGGRLEEEHRLGGRRRVAALAGVRGIVARDGDDLARMRNGSGEVHAPARLHHPGAQQVGRVVAVDGVGGELERGARRRERRGAASQEGLHVGREQRIGLGLRRADVFAGQPDRRARG